MLKNVDGLKNNTLVVMLGLILVNVFWGASSIAAKEALLQLSAIEIVTIRFTIAFFIILGLALLLKGRDILKVKWKDIPTFILLSLANVSIGFILQVEALNYTTVTNFSIEFNLATFFIILLGAVLLKERLTKKKALGAMIAFAGAALIISGGRLDLSSAHLIGDLMGIGSAAAFGLFTVSSKKIAKRYDLLTIIVYTFLFGVMELLPLYALVTPRTQLTSLSPVTWSSILFLAVACSVFAFLVYTHGLNRLMASDVAMTIYVTPIAGIALAAVMLGEAVTPFTIAGTTLVLAGMYLARGGLEPEKPDGYRPYRDPAKQPASPARGE